MKKFYYLGVIALGFAAVSCDSSGDEPDATVETAKVSIKFVYDYNMLEANAIESQRPSANVWAFNHDGGLVWSGSASADELAKNGFCINADLPAGEYDLVSWCGLDGNNALEISTYKPKSKEDLYVAIKTRENNGLNISDQNLGGLFYGALEGMTVKTGEDIDNSVFLSLVKDTKDISVSLMDSKGNRVDMSDYVVSISYSNGTYAWNNSIIQGTPEITYMPWVSDGPECKLSTGRLIIDDLIGSKLSVRNKANGNLIIDCSFYGITSGAYIGYFNGKKIDVSDMSDEEFNDSLQKFLDREDSYSIVFSLDENNNWNGIFRINGVAFRIMPNLKP